MAAPASADITRLIVDLSHRLGLSVAAEGVEQAKQADFLRANGCDIGQGLGIAAAMPATDVFRWVRDYRGPFALTAAPAAPLIPESLQWVGGQAA